jgi:hypothetical protein
MSHQGVSFPHGLHFVQLCDTSDGCAVVPDDYKKMLILTHPGSDTLDACTL